MPVQPTAGAATIALLAAAGLSCEARIVGNKADPSAREAMRRGCQQSNSSCGVTRPDPE
jgi:hypothetical protein